MCAGRKGYYSVTFFQQVASIGNNIAIQIVAGISMKSIYLAYSSNQNGMTLQEFIIIFGVVELLLSQMPDIHSLRWLNALCTFCTVGFTVTVIGLSIYACKYAHHMLSQMLKSYLLLTGNRVGASQLHPSMDIIVQRIPYCDHCAMESFDTITFNSTYTWLKARPIPRSSHLIKANVVLGWVTFIRIAS